VAARPDPRPIGPLSPPHEWDPVGPEATADIHATLARLRSECPVAGSRNWGGFYTLTRYEDVVAASRDPSTFTATRQTVIPASPRAGLPRLPLQRDPPESERYRTGLNPFFRENRIRALEEPLRASAARLADGLLAAAAPEFSGGFAAPFALETLCRVAGLDLAEAADLGHLSEDYVAAVQAGDLAVAGGLSRRIDAFAEALVADRRARPRDPEADLVSGLIVCSPPGGPYDDIELAGMVRLLLIGGHVVPRNFLGSIAWHLATDRPLQDRLRAGALELRPLVEEFLRFHAPNQALVRVATRPVAIRGRTIPAGCPVALNFLSANRDADVFPDPMEFQPARRPNRHIAFGVGPHVCLGQSVARLQARLTLETLAALPPFRLAGEPRWARWTEYGVVHLPIAFETSR
jgi:cytochrome P450